MPLTINYAIPYAVTADDLRSFWQVLSKPSSTSFQLIGLPKDIFLAADQAQAGTAIRFELAYQKNTFPIDFQVSSLNEQGFLVSILFLNPDQTEQLLSQAVGQTFLKWALGRLHTGGKMLKAEIAFFAQEPAPNAYVKLTLKGKSFTIEQYPLFCWTPSPKASNGFLKEADFTSMIHQDGSELLLSEAMYDNLFGESKNTHTSAATTSPKKPEIYVTKAEIFAAMPDPQFRRETVRWVMHDYKEANQNIINLLTKGLQDADWEVRLSSTIACARYRLKALLPLIKKVQIPTTGRSGLNIKERGIIGDIKKATIAILKGASIPASLQRAAKSDQDRRDYLLRLVAGEKVKHYNDMLLLVIALIDPLYPAVLPEVLPTYITQKEGKLYLKQTGIQVSWIPSFSHWIGSADIPYHPIQLTKLEKGGFISTYPIKTAQFDQLNIKWGKQNKQKSVFCPLIRAKHFCEELSEKEGVPVILPNSMIWEMAARGHNGRIYPWGLSHDNNIPDLPSPWGLRETVGFGAEWTKSLTAQGQSIVMGHSRFMRCYKMGVAPAHSDFSFRVFIELK